MRKVGLAQPLTDPVEGIFIAEFEQGDIRDVLFRVACNMNLEGIVSKRLDRAYAGKCAHWIKVKNPRAPGVQQSPGISPGDSVPKISRWMATRRDQCPIIIWFLVISCWLHI